VTMSTILASRFVAGIRSEVERVEKQLSLFSDTLDQWVQVRDVCRRSCTGAWAVLHSMACDLLC
jgi:hypothetical protein